MGDSLTEGDYGVYGKRCIANVQKENYPYFLSKIFNAEVRNFGKCGFTATHYLNYYKEGNVNLENADVIIIMLGTNGGHDDVNETQANIDYKELISSWLIKGNKKERKTNPDGISGRIQE